MKSVLLAFLLKTAHIHIKSTISIATKLGSQGFLIERFL